MKSEERQRRHWPDPRPLTARWTRNADAEARIILRQTLPPAFRLRACALIAGVSALIGLLLWRVSPAVAVVVACLLVGLLPALIYRRIHHRMVAALSEVPEVAVELTTDAVTFLLPTPVAVPWAMFSSWREVDGYFALIRMDGSGRQVAEMVLISTEALGVQRDEARVLLAHRLPAQMAATPVRIQYRWRA